MSKLYLAENGRDDAMLDVFTATNLGTVYVWAAVHRDFAEEVHDGSLFDRIAKAGGEPVEVVLVAREEYDRLVERARGDRG